MGISERPPDVLLDNLRRRFGFEPPREHGLDVVDSIHAMEAGAVDVFIGLGGNFVSATPDTARTSAAMRRVGLTVHVSTKLNRSHLVHGQDALILPCLGRTEADVTGAGPQAVTVEDSMSMVHLTRGTNDPADPDLPGEPTLVSRLAVATFGPEDSADWRSFGTDYATVRDAIADVIPGFGNFNARLKESPGGFWLGNAAARLEFLNPEAKARFIVGEMQAPAVPEGCLRLMTVRSHDQYNTTVYGLNDRYRGVKGKRDVLFVNADDAGERGLAQGGRVDIERAYEPADRPRESATPGADEKEVGFNLGGAHRQSPAATVRGFEVVIHDLPRGCCAGYFPELNALVSLDSVAVGSNTPVSKLVPVRVAAARR